MLLGFQDFNTNLTHGVCFDYIGSQTRAFERLESAVDAIGSGPANNSNDMALMLDNRGFKLATITVGRLFQRLEGQMASVTVSLVEFNRVTEQLEDLLGQKSGNAVTGMLVESAQTAIETMKIQRCCNERQRDLVATVTVRTPTVGRLHLVFSPTPGLWSCGGLPARILSKCACFMAVGDVASAEGAREFRKLFPVSDDPYARIADLEQQLRDLRERNTLRENTLINQLLSTHTAFDGLREEDVKMAAKKRAKPFYDHTAGAEAGATCTQDTQTHVKFEATDKENVDGNMVAASIQPPLKRLGSNGAGGAVRVLSATPKARSQTPGQRGKTKSRVF